MATPAFDWAEFLTLANELSGHVDEASHRTAISRAYYCVYHKACERAVANGYIDEKSHWKLWDLYRRNTDVKCRPLRNVGDRMKKERSRRICCRHRGYSYGISTSAKLPGVAAFTVATT